MRNDHYPAGIIKDLLQTNLVKQQTIKVLKDRLEKEQTIVPVFFGAEAFRILKAICKRLIPQPDRSEIIDLAGLLDEQFESGSGKGWRYNQMPPGKIAFPKGLYGLNETSQLMFGKTFIDLTETNQDQVLSALQAGIAKGEVWEQMPATRFFEELLALLTELYYSHPVAKEEIGEVAFADGKGWQRIGLNELEKHEPLPLNNGDYAG